MKNVIIHIFVVLIVTSISSPGVRYLISIIDNAELNIFSVENILICAVLPLLIRFFDKRNSTRHTAGSLAIVAFVYTIIYNIIDYWWV